jgi:hypothetical protein
MHKVIVFSRFSINFEPSRSVSLLYVSNSQNVWFFCNMLWSSDLGPVIHGNQNCKRLCYCSELTISWSNDIEVLFIQILQLLRIKLMTASTKPAQPLWTKKKHSWKLLFYSKILKYCHHFYYWNQPLNMCMRVCYLDCHEAGLCCCLVIHTENLLHPLQLFYFHLWLFIDSPLSYVPRGVKNGRPISPLPISLHGLLLNYLSTETTSRFIALHNHRCKNLNSYIVIWVSNLK